MFIFDDLIFSIVPLMISIIFVIVIGTIIFRVASSIKEWSSNNKEPMLNVDAELVSKRSHVSRSAHNHNNNMHMSTSTTYYVTFQVQSGDRMEFKVSGKEYGILCEGDKGNLIFQGTRYHGFDREL